ncbi:MAG: LCP family protein [Oscillochloris sp.]|nr:LCP family protein [Oscillochloris sp.]
MSRQRPSRSSVPSPHAAGTARERIERRRAQKAALQRRTRRRLVAVGALGLLLLVGGLIFVLIGWARSSLQAIEQVDPRRTVVPAAGSAVEQREVTLQEPFTVLLVGLDRRSDLLEGVRGDTLILVYVNPAEAWAGMLSIPRDSVVDIPNLGRQKINAAYSYGFSNAAALYGEGTTPEAGGGALIAETVEGLLGLPVDYVAQIDFRGFERVVDTVGGITVDVPRPLLDASYPTEDYGYERIYIPAGLQVMDGATALRYARSRHSSSDFDRSQRQQQVLRALLAEVRARGLLDQAALLPGLVEDLQQSVNTTLPLSDPTVLRDLVDLAQQLDAGRIVQLSINPNDVGIDFEDGSDIYWNQADVRSLVVRLTAGPELANEAATVQIFNGAAVPGLAGQVTTQLAAAGFTTREPDTIAPIAQSLLIDYGNHPATARRMADWLGIPPDRILTAPPPNLSLNPSGDILLLLGSDYQPRWAGNE